MLPNKLAYRTNPKETEEIRRHVNDFLTEGMIRESLSPCVVPTLLVPKKNGEWRMCVLIVELSIRSLSNIDFLFQD